MDVTEIRHATLKVGPVTVFYREAGLAGRPVLLLLHGFANSSHYFRHLMPLLANRFHVIAPDLPSFGFTKVDSAEYRYTFAQLTQTIQSFVDALQLQRFAMYVFDYGAPVGFNLAVAAPDRITAIISQNGNAYEEGLGAGPWAPLRSIGSSHRKPFATRSKIVCRSRAFARRTSREFPTSPKSNPKPTGSMLHSSPNQA